MKIGEDQKIKKAHLQEVRLLSNQEEKIQVFIAIAEANNRAKQMQR